MLIKYQSSLNFIGGQKLLRRAKSIYFRNLSISSNRFTKHIWNFWI